MLRVRRLGTVPYEEAYDLQVALAGRSADDYLLVLQHPHVYTLGVRADPANVLVDPSSVGAALVRTDRGGDVTYHGPGQLVVYPVLDVDGGLGAGPAHVTRLEQVVIDALTDVGAPDVGRLPGYPGVWVGAHGPEPRKVAAVGVRTRRVAPGRRRSLHGVAVNVTTDLSMFGHIVPCGISDRPVTSLAAEGLAVSADAVADAIVARAVATWGAHQAVEEMTITRSRRAPSDGSGTGVGVPVHLASERPPVRRLRQAGVDPDAGLALRARKPPWLRAPVRMGADYLQLGKTLHGLDLVTVCEEAGCPNIYECWSHGTATFMINGDRCTRACGFCKVDTRRPMGLDAAEPEHVAEAVARMDLAHVVVTCVARDDLLDGGAAAMAATVRAIRRRRPGTTVETLVSDYRGRAEDLALVVDAAPDVLNHNVETVARLQRAVRPSAGYARSLTVLARAASSGLVTKSGLMVGLGETEDEVLATLSDLTSVGVRVATIGQYLRPSAAHLPVARYWAPDEFERLRVAGLAMGFTHVEASPLTRSSYHAKRAADAAGARHAAAAS